MDGITTQSPDIETFVGDGSPDATFVIMRGVVAVPLGGCTINFLLFNPLTRTQTNLGNEACTISDAVNGKCIYSWGTDDKPNPGIYKGYVQITFPTGKPETAEVRVNVKQIGY